MEGSNTYAQTATFARASAHTGAQTAHQMLRQFGIIDSSHDGKLDIVELSAYLTGVFERQLQSRGNWSAIRSSQPAGASIVSGIRGAAAPDIAAATAARALAEADTDGDGLLSFDEFVAWIHSNDAAAPSLSALKASPVSNTAGPGAQSGVAPLPRASQLLRLTHTTLPEIIMRLAAAADGTGYISKHNFDRMWREILALGAAADTESKIGAEAPAPGAGGSSSSASSSAASPPRSPAHNRQLAAASANVRHADELAQAAEILDSLWAAFERQQPARVSPAKSASPSSGAVSAALELHACVSNAAASTATRVSYPAGGRRASVDVDNGRVELSAASPYVGARAGMPHRLAPSAGGGSVSSSSSPLKIATTATGVDFCLLASAIASACAGSRLDKLRVLAGIFDFRHRDDPSASPSFTRRELRRMLTAIFTSLHVFKSAAAAAEGNDGASGVDSGDGFGEVGRLAPEAETDDPAVLGRVIANQVFAELEHSFSAQSNGSPPLQTAPSASPASPQKPQQLQRGLPKAVSPEFLDVWLSNHELNLLQATSSAPCQQARTADAEASADSIRAAMAAASMPTAAPAADARYPTAAAEAAPSLTPALRAFSPGAESMRYDQKTPGNGSVDGVELTTEQRVQTRFEQRLAEAAADAIRGVDTGAIAGERNRIANANRGLSTAGSADQQGRGRGGGVIPGVRHRKRSVEGTAAGDGHPGTAMQDGQQRGDIRDDGGHEKHRRRQADTIHPSAQPAPSAAGFPWPSPAPWHHGYASLPYSHHPSQAPHTLVPMPIAYVQQAQGHGAGYVHHAWPGYPPFPQVPGAPGSSFPAYPAGLFAVGVRSPHQHNASRSSHDARSLGGAHHLRRDHHQQQHDQHDHHGQRQQGGSSHGTPQHQPVIPSRSHSIDTRDVSGAVTNGREFAIAAGALSSAIADDSRASSSAAAATTFAPAVAAVVPTAPSMYAAPPAPALPTAPASTVIAPELEAPLRSVDHRSPEWLKNQPSVPSRPTAAQLAPASPSPTLPVILTYFDLTERHCDEVIETFARRADANGLLSKEAFFSCFTSYLRPQFLMVDPVTLAPSAHPAHAAVVNPLLERIFASFDADNSGGIDFTELAAGLTGICAGTSDEKLSAAFDVLDFNGDGMISRDELVLYLTSLFKMMMAGQRQQQQRSTESDPAKQTSGAAEGDGAAAAAAAVSAAAIRASPHEIAEATAAEAFARADANGDGVLSLDEFKQWFASPPATPLAASARYTVLQAAAPSAAIEQLLQLGRRDHTPKPPSAAGTAVVSRAEGQAAPPALAVEHADRAVPVRIAPVTSEIAENNEEDEGRQPGGLQRGDALSAVDAAQAADASAVQSAALHSRQRRPLAHQFSSLPALRTAIGFTRLPVSLVLAHFAKYADAEKTTSAAVPQRRVPPGTAAAVAAVPAAAAAAAPSIPSSLSLSRRSFNAAVASLVEQVEALRDQERMRDVQVQSAVFGAAVPSAASPAPMGSAGPGRGHMLSPASVARMRRLRAEDNRLLLSRLFDIFDTDHSGRVDFNELLVGVSTLCGDDAGSAGGSAANVERVATAFALYDANGDGFITLEEMTAYLTAILRVVMGVAGHSGVSGVAVAGDVRLRPLDAPFTPGVNSHIRETPEALAFATAQQAFEEADTNHDGRLSWEEFERWLTSPSAASFTAVRAVVLQAADAGSSSGSSSQASSRPPSMRLAEPGAQSGSEHAHLTPQGPVSGSANVVDANAQLVAAAAERVLQLQAPQGLPSESAAAVPVPIAVAATSQSEAGQGSSAPLPLLPLSDAAAVTGVASSSLQSVAEVLAEHADDETGTITFDGLQRGLLDLSLDAAAEDSGSNGLREASIVDASSRFAHSLFALLSPLIAVGQPRSIEARLPFSMVIAGLAAVADNAQRSSSALSSGDGLQPIDAALKKTAFLFSLFDRDGDGSITKDEAASFMRPFLAIARADQAIRASRGDPATSAPDALQRLVSAVHSDLEHIVRATVADLFAAADADGDGRICLQEFASWAGLAPSIEPRSATQADAVNSELVTQHAPAAADTPVQPSSLPHPLPGSAALSPFLLLIDRYYPALADPRIGPLEILRLLRLAAASEPSGSFAGVADAQHGDAALPAAAANRHALSFTAFAGALAPVYNVNGRFSPAEPFVVQGILSALWSVFTGDPASSSEPLGSRLASPEGLTAALCVLINNSPLAGVLRGARAVDASPRDPSAEVEREGPADQLHHQHVQLFSVFDRDGDGSISVEEAEQYLTAVVAMQMTLNPPAALVRDLDDVSADMVVASDDARSSEAGGAPSAGPGGAVHSTLRMAHAIARSTAAKMFEAGDVDRDGRITLPEFLSWMGSNADDSSSAPLHGHWVAPPGAREAADSGDPAGRHQSSRANDASPVDVAAPPGTHLDLADGSLSLPDRLTAALAQSLAADCFSLTEISDVLEEHGGRSSPSKSRGSTMAGAVSEPASGIPAAVIDRDGFVRACTLLSRLRGRSNPGASAVPDTLLPLGRPATGGVVGARVTSVLGVRRAAPVNRRLPMLLHGRGPTSAPASPAAAGSVVGESGSSSGPGWIACAGPPVPSIPHSVTAGTAAVDVGAGTRGNEHHNGGQGAVVADAGAVFDLLASYVPGGQRIGDAAGQPGTVIPVASVTGLLRRQLEA